MQADGMTFSTGKQIKKSGSSGRFWKLCYKMQLWLVLMLLTADLKYHQFYEPRKPTLLADIGHFESERYTKIILLIIFGKILNFAIILSEENKSS
jgi:hypothetical protein